MKEKQGEIEFCSNVYCIVLVVFRGQASCTYQHQGFNQVVDNAYDDRD